MDKGGRVQDCRKAVLAFGASQDLFPPCYPQASLAVGVLTSDPLLDHLCYKPGSLNSLKNVIYTFYFLQARGPQPATSARSSPRKPELAGLSPYHSHNLVDPTMVHPRACLVCTAHSMSISPRLPQGHLHTCDQGRADSAVRLGGARLLGTCFVPPHKGWSHVHQLWDLARDEQLQVQSASLVGYCTWKGLLCLPIQPTSR